ncbi:MAG: tetratricopeptide repeat protein, partial [Anaerolineae bacterium]|nr:tetratricopeptide repeat protein [Anaerolineae bacterium]
MNDDILTALAATTDPAEKAALVAEFALADLPPAVATAARRAVILHWFNTEVLAALLPAESELPAADVYNLLAGLPFIEHLPHGLAYHDLTRTGLLTRYMANQSDALRAGATLAASVYAAAEDKMVVLEGLYCHILAGNQTEATGLLETLIYWAGAREDWAALLNVFEIRDEAERYTFAETLPRIALHYFATGLAHQSLKQYDKALADYTRAIELNPEDAAAYNNRG